MGKQHVNIVTVSESILQAELSIVGEETMTWETKKIAVERLMVGGVSWKPRWYCLRKKSG